MRPTTNTTTLPHPPLQGSPYWTDPDTEPDDELFPGALTCDMGECRTCVPAGDMGARLSLTPLPPCVPCLTHPTAPTRAHPPVDCVFRVPHRLEQLGGRA